MILGAYGYNLASRPSNPTNILLTSPPLIPLQQIKIKNKHHEKKLLYLIMSATLLVGVKAPKSQTDETEKTGMTKTEKVL